MSGLGNQIKTLLLMSVLTILVVLIGRGNAVSRSREYLADSTGARIAGHSRGLSNALLKLEQASRAIPMDVSPAASHLFIVNPLSTKRLMNLFSTHPSTEDRVRLA